MQEMAEWIEYMTFDGVSPLADLRRKNGREKPWRVDYFDISVLAMKTGDAAGI